jgi:hypothetical protein
MGSKKDSDSTLVEFAPSDREYQLGERVLVRFELDAVEGQKYERGDCANSLVAVDEWVSLYEMVKVGGRHFEKVRVKKGAAIGAGRLGERGLKQPRVAHPERSAIASDLILMDRENFELG